MRPHTPEEAVAVVEAVAEWQRLYRRVLGRRLVYAADEYYLLAGVPFPPAEEYDGFVQHENGIGMARAFEVDLASPTGNGLVGGAGHTTGFFQWVEGAPPAGYRAPRTAARTAVPVGIGARDRSRRAPVVLTGEYGARVLSPLLAGIGRDDVEIVAVKNAYFGGNIAVTGLLTGSDVGAALEELPEGGRYLLPDVCLSNGVFLDGVGVSELPRPVEVVATDGRSLRAALERR